MDNRDDLVHILHDTRLNTVLSWAIVLVLIFLATVNFFEGRFTWTILIIFIVIIVILPGVFFCKPSVMPSWLLLLLVLIPIVGNTTAYYFFLTRIPVYISVATLSLLIVAELNWFTSVRMNPKFAIYLVIITTLAVTGMWHFMRWVLDVMIGTTFLLDGRSVDAINAAVMYEFIYALIAGIVAGVLFGWYFKTMMKKGASSIIFPDRGMVASQEHIYSEPPKVIRKLLGLSVQRQKNITIFLQACLVVLFIFGIFSRELHILRSAFLALIITFVPAFMRHRHNLSLDPSLTLWITIAVFLDAIGTFWLYDNLARWDNLTHAASSSTVAAAGYVILRAIDIYDPEINIPPRTMFVFIPLFILSVGVMWEILEFITDELTLMLGIDAFYSQHGIHDTMGDMLFNLIGSIVVAFWGTVYLNSLSYKIAELFEKRFDSKKQ
ncbi:hypothetical protein BKM01_05260 [Methanohalophilus portucalensis]|nr:hypothetical protein BKM01_05260 [Methanohalophilus portucalensis]